MPLGHLFLDVALHQLVAIGALPARTLRAAQSHALHLLVLLDVAVW